MKNYEVQRDKEIALQLLQEEITRLRHQAESPCDEEHHSELVLATSY